MQLTANFTLEELLKSGTADAVKKRSIDKYNLQYSPPESIVNALKALCEKTLQPLRDYCKALYPNSYIRVSSGYRCEWVNTAIKGAKSSQHKKGQAADIDLIVDGVERNDLLVKAIQQMNTALNFDQLILEFGASPLNPSWVHISYNNEGAQRRTVLRKADGKPYVNYPLFQ